MFYVDSKRTITRRESSLIKDADTTLEPGRSAPVPKKRCIQDELVTLMFESMLSCIVDSWETIEQTIEQIHKETEPIDTILKESPQDTKKKKRLKSSFSATGDPGFSCKSGSVSQADDDKEYGSINQVWWSIPDEKAIIHFKNGNKYEGDISMKLMHGNGRYQWNNGTVYMGHFEHNKIVGYGTIYWKDDTWYQGEFDHNLRHGKGLYVDSRRQRSYVGNWRLGAKHGDGRINYHRTLDNVYDGQWSMNQIHGFGSQQYSASCEYVGMWNSGVKQGHGVMIWPNHDFYRGNWANNKMSGEGFYIWDNYYNCTMVPPCLKIFRGNWTSGKRNGFGQIRFGTNLGAIYQGNYVDDKKDGDGKLITATGRIFKDKCLFIKDVGIYQHSIGFKKNQDNNMQINESTKDLIVEYEICEENLDLITCHVKHAINKIRQTENEFHLIKTYLVNNKLDKENVITNNPKKEERFINDLISFEEYQLRRILKSVEPSLRSLYDKYASICNNEEFHFTPFLIRLYMWQFYYDCSIYEYGLTLYDIDVIFYTNGRLLAVHPHNPFEKIFFWQFLHLTVAVASEMYAKKTFPGARPDNIVANALSTFMKNNVMMCRQKKKAKLRQHYGKYVPMRATYKLYQSIGEPHDIKTFLKAIRSPKHVLYPKEVPVIDMPTNYLPMGRNAYTHSGEMTYLVEKVPENVRISSKFKLFNIANVPLRTIIQLFGQVFPKVSKSGRTLNLNFTLTFFDFFEVLIGCIEESIKLEDQCI